MKRLRLPPILILLQRFLLFFAQMALGFFWASVCLLLFLAILSLDIMGFFRRENKFQVEGRVSPFFLF